MIVKYEVKYWDDFDKEEVEDSGVVCGENEAECISSLYHYYGKDNVNKFSIEFLENTDDNILTKENLEELIPVESNT